jgi:hypothetical protein
VEFHPAEVRLSYQLLEARVCQPTITAAAHDEQSTAVAAAALLLQSSTVFDVIRGQHVWWIRHSSLLNTWYVQSRGLGCQRQQQHSSLNSSCFMCSWTACLVWHET